MDEWAVYSCYASAFHMFQKIREQRFPLLGEYQSAVVESRLQANVFGDETDPSATQSIQYNWRAMACVYGM